MFQYTAFRKMSFRSALINLIWNDSCVIDSLILLIYIKWYFHLILYCEALCKVCLNMSSQDWSLIIILKFNNDERDIPPMVVYRFRCSDTDFYFFFVEWWSKKMYQYATRCVQYLFRCWSDVDVLKETLCSSDQHSNKETDKIHIFNNGVTLSVISCLLKE